MYVKVKMSLCLIRTGMAQSVWRPSYGLGNREIGIQFPEGARDISLLYNIQPPMVELYLRSLICLHGLVFN